tara:strand:+ start:1150 stop:1317 length:168 start_codon:yes stop_codon:yes gene_type:complete
MKYLLALLPFVLSASLANAHSSVQLHHHLNDPSWLPVIGGVLVIAAAAVLSVVRK